MDKLISLFKTDFNITFGLSSIAYSFKSRKNRWPIIVLGIAMLTLIPSYILLIKSLEKVYYAYRQIGQSSYFLLTGFLGAQMLVFLFGLLYVMSKYYFSNDLAHLVPLPINPSTIVGAKFGTLMISEYLTSLPIILPFIFIYGIKGGEGILYWIFSFVLILFLPIIPLVLASILVMLFMKYTNIKGKKDLIRVIGGILFLVLMLAFQFKMQNIAQKALVEGEEFFFELVKNANLLVTKLGRISPPSMWAALSLGNYESLIGFTNLIIFILASISGLIIMIVLSEKFFFDGLIGNREVSVSKGRGRKSSELTKLVKVNKPFIAIALKEVKMLFKTPIYLLNSIGGVIIIPILILMSLITGDESMEVIKPYLMDNKDLVVLGGIGIITFLGISNSIGSTTFSREGKCFWIQRTLPIRIEDQIFGRILSSLIIQLIGVIALIGSIFFFVKLSLVDIFLISFLGLLGSIPATQLCMVVDIIRPLLDWDNPQKAIKQNLNVLIGMGVGTIYIGAIFLIIKSIFMKVEVNIIYGILLGIFIVSSLGLYIILKKLIEKQFIELE